MQRGVVRLVFILQRYFLTCAAVLLIEGSSSVALGQKSVPLASQAQGISEYELLVRYGLPLAHEDSVLLLYGQMKGLFRSLPMMPNHYGKCGTELANEAHNIQIISKNLRQAVIFSTQSLSDSVKSPSGRFTIYYDKSGSNAATSEYVDSIAHFADEAYQLEVVELGYPKPPYSFADSTWHIELQHLGAGFYGVTTPFGNALSSSPSGLKRYLSYITIDNSFESGYATLGLPAARITVFHEFHHVIQNGSYGTNDKDVAFREMMAVWMEMRSTPWVPDYLQYIPSYTLHLDKPFDSIDNIGYYGQCVWMQYLSQKYGDEILKDVWDFYATKLPDYLFCFDSILTQHGTNFCTEYERFGTAIYYTGRNFQGTSPFPDARKFNVDEIQDTIIEPNVARSFLAYPTSLHIFLCGYGKDTSVIVISRSTDRSFQANATVTSKSPLSFETTYQLLPETFCDTISLPTLVATKIFPQPFVISSSDNQAVLNILAATNSSQPSTVDLNIYSAGNTLIRHYERSTDPKLQTLASDPFGGSWYVEWDGRDDLGRIVPSGVYYYSVYVDGHRDGGKFVVIRKN